MKTLSANKKKIYCIEGGPDKFPLHDVITPYLAVRGELGELSVVHGVLLKGSRVVVPSTMRLQVLDKVHEGHQGIVKSRESALQDFSMVAWSQLRNPGHGREL